MAESQEAPDKLIKIIFVGDSGVGKTCLIERMVSTAQHSSRQEERAMGVRVCALRQLCCSC